MGHHHEVVLPFCLFWHFFLIIQKFLGYKKTSPNIGSKVLLVDDLTDSGITLKKSIDWMQHFYGFYLDEPIRTAVLFHKAVSSFKPDYCIDYLEDSPWIHMPFEKYEDMSIEDLKK